MTGAMHKNDITGFVDYDKNHCASCYMCIMNCPYGVLQADEETSQIIMKCNMCNHKLDGPMCVKKCPMNAITVEEVATCIM